MEESSRIFIAQLLRFGEIFQRTSAILLFPIRHTNDFISIGSLRIFGDGLLCRCDSIVPKLDTQAEEGTIDAIVFALLFGRSTRNSRAIVIESHLIDARFFGKSRSNGKELRRKTLTSYDLFVIIVVQYSRAHVAELLIIIGTQFQYGSHVTTFVRFFGNLQSFIELCHDETVRHFHAHEHLSCKIVRLWRSSRRSVVGFEFFQGLFIALHAVEYYPLLEQRGRFGLQCIGFFSSFECSFEIPSRIVRTVGQCFLIDELRLRVIDRIESITTEGETALQPRIGFRVLALTSIVAGEVKHSSPILGISCGEILDKGEHLQAVALGAEHHEEIRVSVVLTSGQLLRYSNCVEIAIEGSSCVHSKRICHGCADGTDALRFVQKITLRDRHHLSVIHDGTTHILFLVGCTQGVVREDVVSICREDVGSKRLRLFFDGEERLLPRCTSRTHCCAACEEG